MDLEYMKQLRNMYAEQHIVSKEFLNELKKAVCDNEAKINEATITPQERPHQSETFESYMGMTRQQRRAYVRRLAKACRKKY